MTKWAGQSLEYMKKAANGAFALLAAFRIEPSTPYPTEYQACLDAASKEVAQKSRPAIKSQVEGLDSYDVVFIGFPIWWYNAPMIIDTFLESYYFSGKTVVLSPSEMAFLIDVFRHLWQNKGTEDKAG